MKATYWIGTNEPGASHPEAMRRILRPVTIRMPK